MKPSRIPQLRKRTTSAGPISARTIPRDAVVLLHDERPALLNPQRVRLLALVTTSLIAVIAAMISLDPLHLVARTKWHRTTPTITAAATPPAAPVTGTLSSVGAVKNASSVSARTTSAPTTAATGHVGYAAPQHPTSATENAHPSPVALPPLASTSWATLVREAAADGITLSYRDTHLQLPPRHSLALTDQGQRSAHPVVSVDVISDAAVRWLEDHGVTASWCPDLTFDHHHFSLWRGGDDETDDGTLHLLQCPRP